MKKKTIIIIVCVLLFLLVQNLFIGYRFSWGIFKELGDIRMAKIPGNAEQYNMKTVESLGDNPLKGKKVLFLGSSVTYGSASIREGIPEYFKARFGCDITKEAVSGTTLVDNGSSSYVQRLLNKVDSNEKYDLVIVQLSTNDASKKLPLGDISTSQDRDSFDTSTITGAIEFIIAYAQETWNCPVAFYTNAKYDSDEYETMYQRLIQLQKKWEIGVIDLWSSTEFNNITAEERSLYMNDKIHPTKAGYKLWWCPEIEKQVLSWLETK